MKAQFARYFFVVGFLLLAFLGSANGQQSPTPSSSHSAVSAEQVINPRVVAPGQLYDKELDLRFNYPVEMAEPAGQFESSFSTMYRPEKRIGGCLPTFLYAELPAGKSPPRVADLGGVWVDDSEEYKRSRKPQAIFATILMAEYAGSCLPQEYKEDEKAALDGVSKAFISVNGIDRHTEPLWYEVGKQKICAYYGTGRPILKTGEVDPAPMVVLALATNWRGHVLIWVFTSNHLDIFNQMTQSLVQFGEKSTGPIFPHSFGAKEPVR